MNNQVLIIPAAGEGSRLKSATPKIFTEIDGRRTIYDYILDESEDLFNNISLILNPSGEKYLQRYVKRIPQNMEILIQTAATGMFDAIDIALNNSELITTHEKIFIQWGDQPFIDRGLYKALSNDLDQAAAAIPLVWVQDPYVQFKFSEDGITILESREGDHCDAAGFKDIGLFSFNKNQFLDIWEIYKGIDSKGMITNEKSFLKIIPLFSESQKINWRTDQPTYKGLGINTREELAETRLLIDQLKCL